MIEKYQLEKVVVSMGLGTKGLNQIEKISRHLESLMKQVLPQPQKPKICLCKKSNAKFKIRKGQPIGLKLTLRKLNALKFIQILKNKVPSFIETLSYNSSTLYYGVKDHRDLRLERFNYEAPSYGFNIALVFSISS